MSSCVMDIHLLLNMHDVVKISNLYTGGIKAITHFSNNNI